MPPQAENINAISSDDECNHPTGPSYWDAPPERSLDGKSLSQMHLSELESNRPEEKKEQKDSYWENHQHDFPNTDDNDDEHNKGENGEEEEREDGNAGSYWHDHRSVVDRSLQGKSLSSLNVCAMEKQHPDDDDNDKDEKSASFWDWRGEVLKKSLSQLSLRSLRTSSTSSPSDCVNEDDYDDVDVPVITNKVHNLRKQWRKSFRRLSQRSMRHLDETTANSNDSGGGEGGNK